MALPGVGPLAGYAFGAGNAPTAPTAPSTQILGSQFAGGANMANLGQQQTLFGNTGASWLNTPAAQQISSLSPSVMAQAQAPAGLTSGAASLLAGEAGVSAMTPEQQANQQQYLAAERTAAMTPLLQNVASAQATAEQQALARGGGYNPYAARAGQQQLALGAQSVGLQQQLEMEQRRQAALAALPGTAGAAQTQALQPSLAQAQIQQAQAALGAQQAQLGLAGFGQVTQAQLGQANLANQQYLGQLGSYTDILKQQREQQLKREAGLAQSGGALMNMLGGQGGSAAGAGAGAEAGGASGIGGASTALMAM